MADTSQQSIHIFEQHTRSGWMKQLNQQSEAIARNPESVNPAIPNTVQEPSSDRSHCNTLESYYQNEDFEGMQSFGEQQARQLKREASPQGEAWRLLNQSPDRFYPDANEHKILGAMELGVTALEHPNTWAKQKDWPTDEHGNPVYDPRREMSETIARLRQHFKGCDYQRTLILKPDRIVHSPDIRTCSTALVTDHSIVLHRDLQIRPFLEYLSGSGFSGLEGCEPTTAGEGCVALRLGISKDANNYYRCGCCIKEEQITVRLNRPQALRHARIEEARWDDRIQFWWNDQNVWQSSRHFPPETKGRCDRGKNKFLSAPVSLPSLDDQDNLTFRIRTSVGDRGEGYALARLHFKLQALIEADDWMPTDALEQLKTMRQWHRDGLCRLSLHCLELMSDSEHTVHGQVIPLQPSLSKQLPANCKTARAEADCFYYKNAYRNEPPDDCDQYAADPQCEFLDSRCLGESPSPDSGICYTRESRYDCGYTGRLNRIGIEESLHCEGQPMQCMLGECRADVTEADNEDFASAVSALHAAQQMAHDMQCSVDGNEAGSSCRIFSGTSCHCKKGIFNMVDCCHLPTNVNFASYMNLLLMGYLFDQSTLHLHTNFPNQLTGQYQKMRETVVKSTHHLREPANKFVRMMEKSWQRLTKTLWPTPAEVHTQAATAKPVAGKLTEEAQKSLLSQMQQQLMRKMAEVVQQVLGEDVTNLLFRTVGNSLASQGGQLSQQALILNPAITSAVSAVTMIYTAYTLTRLLVQITYRCEENEFELAAKREMKVCHKVGRYRKSKLLGLSSLEFNSYCCFNSPLSRILQVQIRQQLGITWGSAKHPDCSGITPEILQTVDWSRIDLSEWLALLKLQNKLPELNAETLKQLNLETLTGKGSRLDYDQQREDSRKRLESRFENVSAREVNQYQNRKAQELRNRSNR